MGEMRTADIVDHTVLVLLGLAVVPVLDRAIVTCDAAVDFRLLAADRACELLACQIAVVLAHGISRRHCVIRQLIVLGNLADKVCRSLPVGKLLAEESVENSSGCVQCLQIILNIQRGEDILCVADRQVRGVGVVRCAVHVSRNDIRELLLVVHRKSVGRGLRRRRLQVVKVAVLLLVVGETLSHVIEHVACKFLRPLIREIRAQPLGIEAHLIHADQADRGEVVAECPQISLRVRIQSVLEKPW